MSTKLLILSTVVLAACINGKIDDINSEPSASEPSDNNDDNDNNSEPSASVTYTENPYSSYTGWESLDIGRDMNQAQADVNCMAVWDMTGTANPQGIPSTCVGCEFTFDLTATYRTPDGDPANGQNLENACEDAASDFSFSYGYTPDYQGYGAAVMYSQDGSDFAGWILNSGPAPDSAAELEESTVAFDGSTFTYTDGYKNYLYSGENGDYPDLAGKYFTNFWAGEATVE